MFVHLYFRPVDWVFYVDCTYILTVQYYYVAHIVHIVIIVKAK